MKLLPSCPPRGVKSPKRRRTLGSGVRPCPGCRGAHHKDAQGRCAHCGGLWLPASRVEALAPGQLAAARRLAGKGPVAPLQCPDCLGALKALDVPGPIHEGDLFWGLETARPQGTAVADACPRCGGVWVDAENLGRAGDARAFLANLAAVLRGAS